MTPTLDDLHQALRASWGPDTCAPEDVRQWSTTNVARGQCGTSALVVHDHFGGRLVRGEVHIHGERVDYHWWNLLPSGEEVDFTRAQFDTKEVVVGGNAVERPTQPGRLDTEYRILRRRVDCLLAQRHA
ncbi:hypothetical protein LB823_15530 [Tsukamurella sp. M9C]|uniref:YunG family protein n=1 Tax=unclassified Tsukamurella TaxID=2633480 RepID=UPI001CCB8124|nr:hypothetical protein [Tsukamurella sp. M9C]MCA0157603.1 hypothetical protein [Tsukamurella sp. M9C]